MHKLTLNRARFDLRIAPLTPLLIKSGDKGAALLHPERPDLTFVRTEHGERGETVYLPGSSLKGVVRSSAERVLRSLGLPCCDPMDHRGVCQDRAVKLGNQLAGQGDRQQHRMAEVYRTVCLACRTFGCQAIASRVSFADAYPPADLLQRTNTTESRSGVSIDRQTGGPSKGKLFEFEAVTGGAFDTAIHVSNYELWQLSLLVLVLRDIQDGFVRLGSAKSRGLGRVSVAVQRLVIDQIAPAEPGERLAGVGDLDPALRKPYALLEGDSLLQGPRPRTGGLGHRFDLSGAAVEPVLDQLLDGPWQALLSRRRK